MPALASTTAADVLRAYAPYLVIIVIFSITNIPAVVDFLAKEPFTYIFDWPGLDIVNTAGDPVATTFKFNWLPAAGTHARHRRPDQHGDPQGQAGAGAEDLRRDLRRAELGDHHRDGGAGAGLRDEPVRPDRLAGCVAGRHRRRSSRSSRPILGWIGVAVTGSDTSSNSLFGALQVQAAAKAGLDPVLMAAANSSGGVLGKMVSPQNLAIAAAAVGMAGQEGEIFRKVIGWSLLLLVLMCVIVGLQATPVLSWMVP